MNRRKRIIFYLLILFGIITIIHLMWDWEVEFKIQKESFSMPMLNYVFSCILVGYLIGLFDSISNKKNK